MTLFGNLKEKTQNMEAARDSVGGIRVRETDIYEAVLKLAYAGKSKGGANFLSIVMDLPDGSEYKEDLYFTSSDEKGNLPYYTKGEKQFPLPGYTTVSDLCLILGGTSLEEATFEEKTVKIYDFDAKAELPKSVMVATELLGKKILVGIQKQIENKQTKDANGVYVDSGETREINVIDKLFDFDSRMTVLEAINGATEPGFYDTWVTANKGKTRDNTKKKGAAPAAGGAAGAPPKAAGAAAAPKTSLFGKK